MLKVALKSQRLQKVLARKNKSQNWLARRMEISSGYMSQLVTGTRNPSPRMRERMLEVLKDCSFDDLFKIIERDGSRN